MLFNSNIFVFIFLPVCTILYYFFNYIKFYKTAKIILILFSFLFYGFYTPKNIGLILFSIIFNFSISKFTYKSKISKFILLFGIFVNFALIFYYKYYNFFIVNINNVFSASFEYLNVTLPLGISFFTFQQISFLIDSSKNDLKYSFVDYVLFVVFFPQLIAGPIIMHSDLINQFNDLNRKKVSDNNIKVGFKRFVIGLFKKTVIADTLGVIVAYCFDNFGTIDSFIIILSMLSYSLQIYFDFSGYSDMAIGISKLFNFDIIENFNSPYVSITIREFWKRWHISLSNFLTDYIYIPIGGNRRSKLRNFINVMIVFVFSGIWHGANFTFILWGGINGLFVYLSKYLVNLNKKVACLINFVILNFLWLLFRSDSVEVFLFLTKKIFDYTNYNFKYLNEFFYTVSIPELQFISKYFYGIVSPFYAYIIVIALLLVVVYKFPNSYYFSSKYEFNYEFIFYAFMLFYSIISFSGVSTFLYYNF